MLTWEKEAADLAVATGLLAVRKALLHAFVAQAFVHGSYTSCHHGVFRLIHRLAKHNQWPGLHPRGPFLEVLLWPPAEISRRRGRTMRWRQGFPCLQVQEVRVHSSEA